MLKEIAIRQLEVVATRLATLPRKRIHGYAFAWHDAEETGPQRMTLADGFSLARMSSSQLLYAACCSWRDPTQSPQSELEVAFPKTEVETIPPHFDDWPDAPNPRLTSYRGVMLHWPSGEPNQHVPGYGTLNHFPGCYDFAGPATAETRNILTIANDVGLVISKLPKLWQRLYGSDLPHHARLQPVTAATMAIVYLGQQKQLPIEEIKDWMAWRDFRAGEPAIPGRSMCSIRLWRIDRTEHDFARLMTQIPDLQSGLESLVDWMIVRLRRVRKNSTGGGKPRAVKQVRKTARGEAQKAILAALTTHHKYSNGRCEVTEPIGVNELGRLAGQHKGSSASNYLKTNFNGKDGYIRECNNGAIHSTIAMLNGELTATKLASGANAKIEDFARSEDDE